MPPVPSDLTEKSPAPARGTFRRAVLRGLGVVMPPLLTLVLFIWAWNAIENYVLRPLETGIRYAVVWNFKDIRTQAPQDAILADPAKPQDGFTYKGIPYVPDSTGSRFLPL